MRKFKSQGPGLNGSLVSWQPVNKPFRLGPLLNGTEYTDIAVLEHLRNGVTVSLSSHEVDINLTKNSFLSLTR